MKIKHWFLLSLIVCLASPLAQSWAEESVTLENAQDPGPNELDEPVAKEFSLPQAIHFLDSASLTWIKERQCFTCHTNYAYLYARPLIAADAPAHRAVRSAAEELITKRWPNEGPRWDAEVVATAAALAFNDRVTTGKLHALTRQALDRTWTVQRDDGGFTWLKCGWPPMESDDDYGVALAALAVSVAPDDYRNTDAAKQGIANLRRYLAANPPPTTHHEALLLWASSYGVEFLNEAERHKTRDKLLALERDDGGWSLPTLGNWQRADKTPQDEHSDGYGTGFVVFVLRQAGVPADDARLRRGVEWLKTHQRKSGRWITRSLKEDSQHYITHCGTAYALMALASCQSTSGD